ncbi:suppressor of cytokine signaling 2 [Sander vitreus]
MTCQSSESTETLESDRDRRANANATAVESDESTIAVAMKDLKNTGWYWGSLTANEAKEILQDASEGTFLVRDSSQRDYLFTISAMTSAGPTNLRIEYKHGKFKLDSVVLVKPKLKQFTSVVHLVEHYVQLSRASDKAAAAAAAAAVAVASNSQPNGTVQLLLTRPVYTATPALQHLCRIAINRQTRRVQELPLPNRLKDYLTDYTYHV